MLPELKEWMVDRWVTDLSMTVDRPGTDQALTACQPTSEGLPAFDVSMTDHEPVADERVAIGRPATDRLPTNRWRAIGAQVAVHQPSEDTSSTDGRLAGY
jgi:hypothetical protein